MKNTVVMGFLVLSPLLSFAAESTPWIFTSSMPAKNEIFAIPRKEFCRPFSANLMPDKCVQYKRGYVCPASSSGSFVINTFDSKRECEKNLKKAKRVLATR